MYLILFRSLQIIRENIIISDANPGHWRVYNILLHDFCIETSKKLYK